ncbi:MAG: hypothetical protein SFZ02_05730 [bacterium]|nr:hypothetical protein [bacterium]
MAYDVHWIVKYQVIYVGLLDDITLDDFRDSSKQIADYMDEAYSQEVTHKIIGVIDLTHAKLGTLMRFTLSAAQDIANVIDPRNLKAKPGFTILVTVSEVAKLITGLVIRLSRQPMTTVATLDEALNVVGNMYPELKIQLTTYQADEANKS